GDPDLTVELVLPIPAFRDFCTENRCLVTAADPAESATVLRMVSGSAPNVFSVGAH
ncbi:phenol hydroxylase subunit, partial [Escherichia coli]|uniref:phenol hydroxylase subunit n=2 Tax=Pseudomonadota TaxID=1224 RepID=UPI003D35D36A